MTSVIGCYGPLIDLSSAASYVGDLVQLLVFVHRSTPVPYKLSKGGDAIRTDIQVGDDTRPFFSVSLWQKQLGIAATAGDVIFLQNVKIIKFGDVVEAKTVHFSSILCLIKLHQSLISKGVDDLVAGCQVGKRTKEKLIKVIQWVQQRNSAFLMESDSFQRRQFPRNWSVPKQMKSQDCFSLSEVKQLSKSCMATFYASISEIFLPITWRALGEVDKEQMFVSRRLSGSVDEHLVEDLICTGCQLCGSPLQESLVEGNSVPLHCDRSSNRLHAVNRIYRPFTLYVWDELDYMPILVKTDGAELLFGNIKAERVYRCYKEKKQEQYLDSKDALKANRCNSDTATGSSEIVTDAVLRLHKVDDYKKDRERKENQQCDKNINCYRIWLILLKLLVKQGKNSPMKFKVVVNEKLDKENGRFEMVGFSVPCPMKRPSN